MGDKIKIVLWITIIIVVVNIGTYYVYSEALPVMIMLGIFFWFSWIKEAFRKPTIKEELREIKEVLKEKK